MNARVRRIGALAIWVFAGWVLLTWTRTWGQLLVGVVLSLGIALACAPLGDVAEPWQILRPRRLVGLLLLGGEALIRIVRANVSLARRIWLPSRPLRSGMIILPTAMRSEGGLTAVGLITSVIVDNQVIDLDLHKHELQYHAVWIDSDTPEKNRENVNGPIEKRLKAAGVR